MLLLLLIPLVCFGLTLRQAEELALKNFYTVKKERALLKASAAKIKEAKAKLLPSFTFSFGTYRTRAQTYALELPFFNAELTFLRSSFWRVRALLTQPLLSPVALASVKLKEATLKRREGRLELTKSELRLRVRRAYFKALVLQARLKTLEAQKERLSEHLRRVKALYEEGVVPFKDVLETRVALSRVESALAYHEASYLNALELLSFYAGVKVKRVEPPPPPKLEGTPLNHPSLRLLRAALEELERSKELVEASFLPELTAYALLERTDESPLLPKNRYYLALELRWLLFNGGTRLARLEALSRRREALLNELKKTEEELLLRARALRREAEALKLRVESARERLEEALEHYRLAVEKYRHGLAVNAEVLDAEAYVTEAQETLRVARLNYLLKLYELAEVLGR
ncbi:MAG: TolC family protein [Aquificae bacterium]|nr:TolC family protein [Aquificota bacterium]